jgi:hypothetical protein
MCRHTNLKIVWLWSLLKFTEEKRVNRRRRRKTEKEEENTS